MPMINDCSTGDYSHATYTIAQNISMAKFKSKFNLRNCLDHVNAQLNTHLSMVGPASKRIRTKYSLLNPSHGNDQLYEWQWHCNRNICWRPTLHRGCHKRSSSSRRAVWFVGSGARSQACQTCQGHRSGELAQVKTIMIFLGCWTLRRARWGAESAPRQCTGRTRPWSRRCRRTIYSPGQHYNIPNILIWSIQYTQYTTLMIIVMIKANRVQ